MLFQIVHAREKKIKYLYLKIKVFGNEHILYHHLKRI